MSTFQNDKISAIEAELDHLRQKRLAGPRHGPGQSLAVVVVDFQDFFVANGDPAAEPILDSTARLLDAARAAKVPVFLICVIIDDPSEIVPTWAARHDMSGLYRGSPRTAFHAKLGQQPSDHVVEKKHASSFLGTDLADQLRALGVDTVLVTGCTTSGCIRSTAIEGSGLGFRMEVVEEGVYENRPLSGPVALSEMQDRYADVITLDEALAQIETIGAGAKKETA